MDVADLARQAKSVRPDPSSTEVDDLIAKKMKPIARDVVDGLSRMKLTGVDPAGVT